MKRIVLMFLLFSNSLWAQENVVRLKDCYENMLATYPISQQSDIYAKTNELSIQNIKAGWLPNAELKAQATYQSDVMSVSFPVMGNNLGFEGEKDQYKATIDINQLIYDWGRIKAAKEKEQFSLKVSQQNVQVELNRIKEQINQFYFAILLLNQNEEVLQTMLNDLEAREMKVESAVKNGVLLNSDLSAIKAEKIKVKQNIIEISNNRLAAIQILAEITGMEISSDSKFEIPDYEINIEENALRPEFALFDYRSEQLDATANLISKQNKPMFYSFAQVGYGKPGLNMTSDEFDSFYIVGVGLSWNFWDWKQTKRKKEITLLNKSVVNSNKETFDKQVNVALDNVQANIASLQSAIIGDKEIIELREEVTESARSKLDNGIITSSDYIKELSAETQAKLSFETHKILLQQAKVNYLYMKGLL